MSGNMNFAPTTGLDSTELKKLGQDIIDIYGPLLNLKLESGGASDEEIKRGLNKVNKFIENTDKRYEDLDQEIATLRKMRHNKSTALAKKVKECHSTIKELDEKIKLENSEKKVSAYLDYLSKVKEEVELKIDIARLERIIQSNPPDLADSLEKANADLEVAVNQLENSCKDKEQMISDYEKLGPKFQDLRIQYEAQEEEIKTKLWVKEQLETGLLDDTLNESLF